MTHHNQMVLVTNFEDFFVEPKVISTINRFEENLTKRQKNHNELNSKMNG